MDAFIEDAKKDGSKHIDDELIEKWQQATQKQKNEILEAFVSRHKQERATLDLSSITAKEINRLPISQLSLAIASFVFFAFFRYLQADQPVSLRQPRFRAKQNIIYNKVTL